MVTKQKSDLSSLAYPNLSELAKILRINDFRYLYNASYIQGSHLNIKGNQGPYPGKSS
jgi:hypothetical protein